MAVLAAEGCISTQSIWKAELSSSLPYLARPSVAVDDRERSDDVSGRELGRASANWSSAMSWHKLQKVSSPPSSLLQSVRSALEQNASQWWEKDCKLCDRKVCLPSPPLSPGNLRLDLGSNCPYVDSMVEPTDQGNSALCYGGNVLHRGSLCCQCGEGERWQNRRAGDTEVIGG